MRQGDVLNGYRVVTEPSTAGAGMSQWAIADKGGEQSFIKMYLAPKFPMADSPGSEAGKARRREQCKAFEDRHLTIARRLRSDVPGAGHLVTTREFFRVGSCYYKVTRLVTTDAAVALEVCEPRQQLIALRSLLFSMKLLHEQEIVHGDLKPENVLFERTPGGAVTCKLIDFDEAYLSGQPPEVAAIVGDMRYYSPELLRYIKGDDSVHGTDLTTQGDVFALGLLFHALFCGDELPETGRPGYVADAVIDRVAPRLSPKLPPPLRPAVRAMLHHDPARRPSVVEIIDRFSGIDLAPGVPEGPEWITEFATASGMPRPPAAPAAAYNPRKVPPVAPRPATPAPAAVPAPMPVTAAAPAPKTAATSAAEARVSPVPVSPVPVSPRPVAEPLPPPLAESAKSEPVIPPMPTSPRLRMNFGRPPAGTGPTEEPKASAPPPPPPPPSDAPSTEDGAED